MKTKTSNVRFNVSGFAEAACVFFFTLLPAAVSMIQAGDEVATLRCFIFASFFFGWTDERNAGYENSDKRPMLAACRMSVIDFCALCKRR